MARRTTNPLSLDTLCDMLETTLSDESEDIRVIRSAIISAINNRNHSGYAAWFKSWLNTDEVTYGELRKYVIPQEEAIK